MAGLYVDGSTEHLAAMFADALTACPDALVAVFVAAAPRALTTDEVECVRGVVESDPDLLRSIIADEESRSAGQRLGAVVADACPSLVDAAA